MNRWFSFLCLNPSPLCSNNIFKEFNTINPRNGSNNWRWFTQIPDVIRRRYCIAGWSPEYSKSKRDQLDYFADFWENDFASGCCPAGNDQTGTPKYIVIQLHVSFLLTIMLFWNCNEHYYICKIYFVPWALAKFFFLNFFWKFGTCKTDISGWIFQLDRRENKELDNNQLRHTSILLHTLMPKDEHV